MRIRKYDFNYGRRTLMEKVAKGLGAGGVLTSLWPLVGNTGDVSKAYPDELLSIEMLTKGKVKPGDTLTANNIDLVKDMVDPMTYQQVKTMGRRIGIVESTKDVTKLFNYTFLQNTLKNRGRAKLGADGNVWTDGVVGKTWIGGLPFPEPKTGLECISNLTLNWGRNDYAQYPIYIDSLNPEGDLSYHHELLWCELNTTSRNDGTVFNGMNDRLRLQTVFFTAPEDNKGSSFLSQWHYDQRQFPELYGYLPAFKRVRQFPTNQRFEPLVAGITFFLSDAWAAGDPMLTWGNYKIVERRPFLAAVGSKNWYRVRPELASSLAWRFKGKTFMDTWYELIPEVIVFEGEPTGYPRAPVGKKRIYLDARNLMCDSYITYDRNGQLWKQFEPGFCQYKNGDKVEFLAADGHPNWSWVYVHSHDIQANRMSLLRHCKHITGGYGEKCSAGGDDVYNKYFTSQAIARLGSA